MLSVPLAVLTLLACGLASGQSLYKYQDDNGEWIYTDRAPANGEAAEVRPLSAAPKRATVTVTHEGSGDAIRFTAHNGFYAPVEVAIVINDVVGVAPPQHPERLRWVVQPRSDLELLALPILGGAAVPSVNYNFDYMFGDPGAVHRADEGYRAPFVAGGNFPVTQAYPDNATHLTPDSEYAIDIAMPVGTDVHAARGGVVFDVIGTNFRGGVDRDKHLYSANIVRVLHDDGTYAVYAHLNWNSIRVRPGQRVQAGQYIADSGNTGFSTGPHLHFAVQRNAGMRERALPVAFRGLEAGAVIPATGNVLTAYP